MPKHLHLEDDALPHVVMCSLGVADVVPAARSAATCTRAHTDHLLCPAMVRACSASHPTLRTSSRTAGPHAALRTCTATPSMRAKRLPSRHAAALGAVPACGRHVTCAGRGVVAVVDPRGRMGHQLRAAASGVHGWRQVRAVLRAVQEVDAHAFIIVHLYSGAIGVPLGSQSCAIFVILQ